MAVVVDAIDRVLVRWARAHIRQERLERHEPSVADSDTPAAVVGIAWLGSIQAPRLHGLPYSVLAGVFSATSSAVGQVCDRSALPVKASTRRGLSCDEMALLNDSFGAAVAPAQPPLTYSSAQHGPPTEALTGHVYWLSPRGVPANSLLPAVAGHGLYFTPNGADWNTWVGGAI